MRVFCIGPRDDVQRLDMDVELQVSMLRRLGLGVAYAGDWPPIAVRRLRKPRKHLPENLCDFTAVAAAVDAPVLSSRAKQVVEPLLGDRAQWLPLAFDEQEYWLLNLLNIVDALDEERSVITRLPTNPNAITIDAYALRPEAVAQEWMFKIRKAPYDVLVTERFRSLVEDNGLTGLYFQPVWDSGHAPFLAAPNREYIRTRPEIYGPEGFVTNYAEFWPAEWHEAAKRGRVAKAQDQRTL
jgi:hypothetical protein